MVHHVDLQRIPFADFDALAGEYDSAVARSSDLDRFCSSADWVIPAHRALMPPNRTAQIFRDGDAWIALARGITRRGFAYLEPLEAAWGLASPLVNAAPEMVVGTCAALEWDVLLLAGVLDGRYRDALLGALGARFAVRRSETTSRHVVDLEAGLDAYLGRLSRQHRRSLARSRRRAARAGIETEIADRADPDAAFARMQAVERRSWKGRKRVGFEASGMGEFYRLMIRRLARRQALRLRFLRAGDDDVAFIFGGLFAGTYRGLQFGYDAAHRELGLGNLCQIEQIAALCDEGVSLYDLGTTGDHYKRRWSDRTVNSTTLVVVKT